MDELDEVIKNLKFENISYLKNEEYDRLYTLTPFETNGFLYALQGNENKKVNHAVHSLFSSMDNDGEINYEQFITILDDGYDEDEYSISEEYLMSDFLTSLVFGITKIFTELAKGTDTNKAVSIAIITLQRLPSTFQSSAILIKNGFYYETICLFRVILEQISYAYQCSKVEPDKVDELKPQSSLSEIKKIFEYAGSLNGFFSKYIHHNKDIWDDFIDEEGYILSRSAKRSKRNILYKNSLVQMFIVVLHDIYENIDLDKDLDKTFTNYFVITYKITEKIKSHFEEIQDEFF